MAPLSAVPSSNFALELIAPGDVDVGPAAACAHTFKSMLVGTNATEISRHVRVRLDAAKSSSLAEIGSVPPSHSGADAHARRKKIPDVPFAQQDPVAAELRSTKKCSVVATRWAWARNIRPLKVSA